MDGVKVVCIADEKKSVQEDNINYTVRAQTVRCHPTESSYSPPEFLTSKATAISYSTWNEGENMKIKYNFVSENPLWLPKAPFQLMTTSS